MVFQQKTTNFLHINFLKKQQPQNFEFQALSSKAKQAST